MGFNSGFKGLKDNKNVDTLLHLAGFFFMNHILDRIGLRCYTGHTTYGSKYNSVCTTSQEFCYFLIFWGCARVPRDRNASIPSPSGLARTSSSSSPEPWQCVVCEGSSTCRQIASCRLPYAGPDGPPVEGGGGDVNADITAACAVL